MSYADLGGCLTNAAAMSQWVPKRIVESYAVRARPIGQLPPPFEQSDMQANVIDTLHFASDLKDAGFPADQAEGLAQALNSELAPQMITPTILRDELRPINEHLGRLDAHVVRLDAHVVRLDDKIDALGVRLDDKIDALGARLDERIDALGTRLDERIDAVESKLETKIDAVAARLDATESKLETKIDTVESKLEAKIDAVASKLGVLTGTMALGFTLLVALILGLYNAVSRDDQGSAPATVASQQMSSTVETAAP